MFWIIFLAIVFWILYKLIFQFVLPIYRSTRVMREKFREMHQHMNDQMNQSNPTQSSSGRAKPEAPKGDYIEFEEIKE